MKIVRRIADLPFPDSRTLGFVPTMGALHEGHLSLMRKARKECDQVIASVFVNPTQFGPNEDFSKYPRQEERDFALCEGVGVDTVFAPTVDEMYPESLTSVHVSGLTDRWEGAIRPGHFDGVATIVAKLFHIVRPTIAYFGWKDLQQCVVLRAMVNDLNMPVQLSFCETVREPDGLAMSSRNAYLSPEGRSAAVCLPNALRGCVEQLQTGMDRRQIDTILETGRTSFQDLGIDVDYFELVQIQNLEPSVTVSRDDRMIGAIRIGQTRLIDNMGLSH